MDKMVLRRTSISDSAAFNLNNSESTCYDASLSTIDLKKDELKIYPNPTNGKIEVRNIPDNANLIISNIFGATVKKVKNKKSTEIIDISNLKAGVYFISNMERKNYFIKKIIKI